MEQEYQAIYDYLAINQSEDWKIKNPVSFVQRIIDKVGIRKSFKYITEIEKLTTPSKIKTKSTFDLLLEKLIHENFFTEEGIKKIYDIESSRRVTGKSPSPEKKNTSSALTAAVKPFKGSPDTKKEDKNYMPVNFHLDDREKIPNSNSGSQKENSGTSKVKSGGTGTIKASYEVSELAVTEYSVASDYLNDYKDDLSDEDDQFQKHGRVTGFEIKRESILGRDPAELDAELARTETEKPKKAEEDKENNLRYNRRDKIFRSVNTYDSGSLDEESSKSIKLEYD